LGEKPANQLAAELGIRRNMLHKWQTQLRNKGLKAAFRGPGAKPLSALSEVERLRRELKRVTEERDISFLFERRFRLSGGTCGVSRSRVVTSMTGPAYLADQAAGGSPDAALAETGFR